MMSEKKKRDPPWTELVDAVERLYKVFYGNWVNPLSGMKRRVKCQKSFRERKNQADRQLY